MKNRRTKVFQKYFDIGVSAAQNLGSDSHSADLIFINILNGGDCHASHILSKLLKEWEVFQIKIRIEREVGKLFNKKQDKEQQMVLAELCAQMNTIAERTNGNDAVINTGHFLIALLRDNRTVSGRVLESYYVTERSVLEYLAPLPIKEDYYENMRSLELPNKFDSGSDSLSQDDDGLDYEIDMSTIETASGKGREKDTLLDKFATNMTRMAEEGKIDSVIGREKEIERLIQILGRRKKNNPILIGEAGVGKSAIVEGLAMKIIKSDVPSTLCGKQLFSLDIAAMVAGTKYRGEFEERIKALIDEMKSRSDIILFIDEIHTIVGAGSTQGSLDTANILKPALARGEMQCIGATTLDEYRENIEKDGALERRFQKIIVEPTTKEQTLQILRNIKSHYEEHHGVRYTEQALRSCVTLTDRYITDRQFPDKAIDVLDEAGSKAHISKSLNPMAVYEIDTHHIEQIITSITGIPVDKVSKDERQRLGNMSPHLNNVVVGQSRAVDKVVKSIQRSRAGLKDPDKPIGVFMFVGATGVGKTLLAKELSQWLFDKKESLIRIDMSEYSEKHNVSRLIGSPPGYVGYNEGGQLTEAVRRQPYAVVLFDEIEKAHPDVFNIMLQIFDEGQLTDGLGHKVDFRNTIIIMTSNVGSREVVKKSNSLGYNTSNSSSIEQTNKEIEYRKALEKTFAPEFINRIDDIVVFNTLTIDDVIKIVEFELNKLSSRAEKLGYKLRVGSSAKLRLAQLGYEPRYGIRSLKRTITEYVEEPLAQMIVCGEIDNGDFIKVSKIKENIELTKVEKVAI